MNHSDGKKVILLVDDDSHLRRELAQAFTKRDRLIIEAGSGQEALNIIRVQVVDLVVCDVQMPQGNGFWLLTQLHSENIRPQYFCFYSSLFASPSAAQRAHGADTAFAKFLEFDQLDAWIRECLDPD